ncbi:Replication protein A 70 kDa DNA-binding subunit C [Bienertia sinuspersici]
MAINYASDIDPSKESWRIVVRVTHLWHVPSYNNPSELQSIELGDKIQVPIKRSMIMTYRHLLNEGESYTLMIFGVRHNSGDYKPTSHAYKINFLNITKVEVNHDASIPLYDVIGYVSGISSLDNIEEMERFGKIKSWQDVTGISNSLFVTQLLINAKVEEVEEYKTVSVVREELLRIW